MTPVPQVVFDANKVLEEAGKKEKNNAKTRGTSLAVVPASQDVVVEPTSFITASVTER